MNPSDVFPPEETGELEESIRIDREIDDEERLNLLRDFHVTAETEGFITDFLQRTLGRTEQKRRGWNHWLYGYYGSGKSHLLAVLGHLTDTEWVEELGPDRVWNALTDGNRELGQLRGLWIETLDAYYLKPLFVNLLKHQGREEKGFNEILLGEAHVEEGLSRRLDAAYFERWYKNHGAWEDRDEDARRVLDGLGIGETPDSPWESVQRYEILSDLVLPRIFEEKTGTPDGLKDLRPSQLNPSEVLSELEEWRSLVQEEVDRPVKLVLLLDEVSLFIGTDYDQLTELQLVAEKLDDIGRGNILSVVTAQERIEHVQPEYAGKSPDFGILKDRFPHRYLLPSRHVGEIIENRLLSKPDDVRQRIEEEVLEETAIRPEDTFIYVNVQQNTEPPLDELDRESFLNYFPLLPYHPPLFMEILTNLRGRDVDRAKSIFSGTARAVLALVDALLVDWLDKREATELVNLVDFFDVIRPELLNIIPQEVGAIADIEEEVGKGKLEEFDVDVAKAVLLLHYAKDMVPVDQSENIAVSVMRDLEGSNRIAVSNRVDEALDRLDKYLGPDLEIRPPEQRSIYDEAQRYEEDGSWDDLFQPISDYQWEDVVQQLDLPERLPYGEDGDTYQVTYTFEVDGRNVGGSFGAGEELRIPIVVEGILPIHSDISRQDKLVWRVKEEGRSPVRDVLRSWASLAKAMEERPPQEAVQLDLEERRNEASKLVAELLENGEFQVRERTTGNRNEAMEWIIEKRYPTHFHPIMVKIGDTNLRELSKLGVGDDRPRWAIELQVPTENPETHGGDIQDKVRGLIGKSIKESGKEQLSIPRLLEMVSNKEPLYENVEEAQIAILWGLCRKGDFLPVTSKGEPVPAEKLLDPDHWSDIRIRISGLRGEFREAAERIPGIEPTHSNDEKVVKLQAFLQQILQEVKTLEEDVDVAQGIVVSEPGSELLDSLLSTLESKKTGAEIRINQVGKTGTDWNKLVDEAIQDHEWLKEAQDVWSRRRTFLLKLDALLSIKEGRIHWLDENVHNSVSSLRREVVNSVGIEWWTASGWEELPRALTSLEQAIEDLRSAWGAYCEEEGREDLARRIERHNWTVQPLQLPPSKIHRAFQKEVLSPLRMFQRAFEEEERLASRLLKEPQDTEYQEFVWLLDNIDEKRQYPDAASVNEARALLQQLNGVVGDKHYEEVQGIGLIPDDAKGLRSNLEEIEGVEEFSLREVEGGMVIE